VLPPAAGRRSFDLTLDQSYGRPESVRRKSVQLSQELMILRTARLYLRRGRDYAVVLGTFVLLICGMSAVRAQDASADALEYRIEIGQHESVVETRRKSGATLSRFVSDGCSGGLSAGWALATATFPAIVRFHGNRPPRESCCVAHDRDYHQGGPPNGAAETSFNSRRLADAELRRCVITVGEDRIKDLAAAYGVSRDRITALYQSIAAVMYRAVRLGGAPCGRLPWRWGFGWPACD
jgi:hypothetical protein